jgi:hypothetical protein
LSIASHLYPPPPIQYDIMIDDKREAESETHTHTHICMHAYRRWIDRGRERLVG